MGLELKLHEVRGERIIRYSNNIRILITNIRIRIRPQIETRILFVFVQKFWSEYYSYSYLSKDFGPNIIRIRIRPKIWIRILFVFVFGYFRNTNIIRLIRTEWAPILHKWTHENLSLHFHFSDDRIN